MLGLPFLLTKPLMGNLAANEYKYAEADLVAFPLFIVLRNSISATCFE
jgi:hypothetical protein